MSGGVDSAVSAFLLKKDGHDVIGANMRFWEYKEVCATDANTQKSRITSCCSPEDLADAENTARGIGVPFYALKMEADFREKVIEPFIADYRAGRTPNPCVHCNTFIKFGEFYEKADALSFDKIATGHYADIVKLPNGRCAVAPATDKRKDQSYYLYGLSQAALERTVFPLAKLTKNEVREIAEQNNIRVAAKPDSQEICFIPDNDYRKFLKRENVEFQTGFFRDVQGRILGKHTGKENFTVGQRRGLQIALGEPRYVIEILDNGDVIIGTREELERDTFYLIEPVFQGIAKDSLSPEGLDVKVQVRYNSEPVSAVLYEAENNTLKIQLTERVWAITPGQAGVIYHKEDGYILCGGKIRLLPPNVA